MQSPRIHYGYGIRNFGISSESAEAVYNFIELDKETQFVEGMDSLEMFVKESDNAEKMRKHGAAFRVVWIRK